MDEKDKTVESSEHVAAPDVPAKREEPPKAEVRLSEQLREIIRREQALSRKEEELRRQAREAEELRSMVELARRSPVEFLKRAGLDDDALRRVAENRYDPTVEELRRELREIRAELETKREEERRLALEREHEAGRSAYVAWFERHGKEKYPLLAAAGTAAEGYDVMVSLSRKNGAVVTEDEAASAIEANLRRIFEAWRPLWEAEARKKAEAEQRPTATTPKGLTNELAASPAPSSGELSMVDLARKYGLIR